MNFAKVEVMADLSLLHWQKIVQVYLCVMQMHDWDHLN